MFTKLPKLEISRRMDKPARPDNGILFSPKKKWASKPRKYVKGTWKHFAKWKKANMRPHAVWFQLYDLFWKRKNYRNYEKISAYQWWKVGDLNKQSTEDLLGHHTLYDAFNYGCTSLYICLNPLNIHQKWTLRSTTDLGWLWHVNIGSSLIKSVLFWKRCW